MYRSTDLEEFFKLICSLGKDIDPNVMRKSSDANLAGLREAIDNATKASSSGDIEGFILWTAKMVGEFIALDLALKSGMPIPTDWNH